MNKPTYDLTTTGEIDESYQEYLDQLPSKVKDRIIKQNARMQSGVHMTAPMMCPGPQKCRIIEFCHIPETHNGVRDLGPASNYPIGHQCVVERIFVQTKQIELMKHLGVDPQNPVEVAVVAELALIDLQKNRVMMMMSKGDRDGQGLDLLRFDSKGFDENGHPIEESKVHPAMDMIDRLEKRRERHLDRLMQTRKAQAELAARQGNLGEAQFGREIQLLREAIQTLGSQPVTIESKERLMLED